MNKYLKRFLDNFARPDFVKLDRPRQNLNVIDKKLDRIENEQLQIRMKLLDLQSSPRGSING
jgi:hypothetical protein